MRWFRVESDMPHHYSIQRILQDPELGTAALGSLLLLWSFAAHYGKDPLYPGRCVDSDGDPIPLIDLVKVSLAPIDQFNALIHVLIQTKGIDVAAWNDRKELCFPGMRTRADAYTKRIAKKAISPVFSPPAPAVQRTPAAVEAAITSIEREVDRVTQSRALARTPRDTPAPPHFATFWALYPRKIDRKRTLSLWTSKGLDVERHPELCEAILEGLRRHIALWDHEQRELRYIASPLQYLKHRRWEDEPPPVTHALTKTTRTMVDATDRFLERHSK